MVTPHRRLSVALISPLAESVPPRLYGGTERVVFDLAAGLSERGVEVTLFASGDSQPRGKRVRLIPVTESALRLRHPPPRDPLAYEFQMLAKVARHAREFDLIHNHDDYPMLPLHRMTGLPVVTTLHGRVDLADLDRVYPSYPECSFISISHSQRRGMPSLNWLATIHHGIETERFQFHPRPGNYLAFLGRMSADKGVHHAIAISKKTGIPLKIAAKIEGRAMEEYFDARVRPHLGRQIEFIGEISEEQKSEFLGGALALCFPIEWPEPFGLVPVESLACGTPVLATPCGAVPEVLKDGVTGFVRPNIDALAALALRVNQISRPECRKWVESRFSLQRMVEDYLDAYVRIIEKTADASTRTAHGRRGQLHSVGLGERRNPEADPERQPGVRGTG